MSTSPATESPIMVDPNGNIMLVVSCAGEVTRFQVFSHILCIVSPVFRAMLGVNSRFKEATELASSAGNKHSTPVEVKIEDDDPHAMALLLWAIHHRPDKVPRSLTFQELCSIAVVIDKYDCLDGLRVWLELSWLPEWKLPNDGFTAKPETEWPKWLFMSYVFGEKKIFKHVSKRLILEGKMRCAESDDFVVEGSIDWQIGVPQRILNEIFRAKKETIALCAEATDEHRKQFERITDPRCKAQGVQEADRQICDAVIYGQLIREYIRLGWGCCGLIHSRLETCSANELKSYLKSISIKYFKGDDAVQSGGCCSNPYRNSYNSNCYNCGRWYTSGHNASQLAIQHRDTCDFTESLKITINGLISAVVGLEYDSWVGKDNNNEQLSKIGNSEI